MAFRDALNEGSPLIRAVVAVATVALICAAIFSYRAMMGSGSQRAVPTGNMTSIRCSSCDYTADQNTEELVANGQIDPLERVALLGNARRCPKCGKQSLVVLEKRGQIRE